MPARLAKRYRRLRTNENGQRWIGPRCSPSTVFVRSTFSNIKQCVPKQRNIVQENFFEARNSPIAGPTLARSLGSGPRLNMDYNVAEAIEAAKMWAVIALWVVIVIFGLSVAAVAFAPP